MPGKQGFPGFFVRGIVTPAREAPPQRGVIWPAKARSLPSEFQYRGGLRQPISLRSGHLARRLRLQAHCFAQVSNEDEVRQAVEEKSDFF